MPEPLRIDPVDLFLSSAQLDMHRADHDAVHGAANAVIESANAGWVGSSARALTGKVAHLQSISAHISGELLRHRDAFHATGTKYGDTDIASAVVIERDAVDGDLAS